MTSHYFVPYQQKQNWQSLTLSYDVGLRLVNFVGQLGYKSSILVVLRPSTVVA